MDNNQEPIRPDELDGLFARFAALGACALAVSGGSDSTALMVLFADWLRLRGESSSSHTVLTVDHGLRAESAAEAQAVAAAAHALGYRHTTLVWHGPKPSTGIQAAARVARYGLMSDHLRAQGIGLLLTAHTRDDQAETLLMRLARGSGLDGLAAMAPLSPLAGAWRAGVDGRAPLWIARPFLDVPKACLRATLETRRIPWIEDPSNAAPEYERTRVRAARGHLDVLGLTPAMLALSAARLARARRALEEAVDRFCNPRDGAVRIDPCGLIAINRARLRLAGDEIVLRVLERAIAAAGGATERPPLGKLEALMPAICGPGALAPGRWTLARALITAQGPVVEIERERGREPLPELTVTPGESALWDGRFRVTAAPGLATGPVVVRALGEAETRDLRRRGLIGGDVPLRVAAATPSIWHTSRLIAAPPLRYWAQPQAADSISVVFIGIERAGRTPDAPG